jgi:hypothetical protein
MSRPLKLPGEWIELFDSYFPKETSTRASRLIANLFLHELTDKSGNPNSDYLRSVKAEADAALEEIRTVTRGGDIQPFLWRRQTY